MIKKIIDFGTDEMNLYAYVESEKEHWLIRKELEKLDAQLSGTYRTHVVEFTYVCEDTIRATIHEPSYSVLKLLETMGWNLFEEEKVESSMIFQHE